MNRKQRMQNRANATKLWNVEACPECGMKERHWVSMSLSLQHMIDGTAPEGFWTCPKFYGPDGRRLEP